MVQWEYLVAKSDGRLDDVETFNELGAQGWELVGTATFSASPGFGGSGQAAAFYFKRRSSIKHSYSGEGENDIG